MAILYTFLPHIHFFLKNILVFGYLFLKVQHGRYLETWYLEAGRDLGTTEADTEVGVL